MKVTVDRRRLRARMIEEDKNSLIRALKQDDAKAAKQALTGMSGEDLGLTHQEFGEITQIISSPLKAMGQTIYDLDRVRQILKIPGKNTPASQTTTQTHNPVTNQPWSSGPVKQGQQKKLGTMTTKDFDSHRSQKLTPAEYKMMNSSAPNKHSGVDVDIYSMSYEDLDDLCRAIAAYNPDSDIKDSLLDKIQHRMTAAAREP